MGITLTPQHQPDPSPPARAPGTARTPRLLGRRLQGVLFLPIFRSAFVVFDFSLFPTELVMSPLGAGAGLAEHEAASSPGEGAAAAAPVHPLVRALALAVVVQVVLLALRRVLWIPLLLSAPLLEVVVATAVAVVVA